MKFLPFRLLSLCSYYCTKCILDNNEKCSSEHGFLWYFVTFFLSPTELKDNTIILLIYLFVYWLACVQDNSKICKLIGTKFSS